MTQDLAGTLLILGAGAALMLCCAAVFALSGHWERCCAARRAERAARPHSARVGTAAADTAAIAEAAFRDLGQAARQAAAGFAAFRDANRQPDKEQP